MVPKFPLTTLTAARRSSQQPGMIFGFNHAAGESDVDSGQRATVLATSDREKHPGLWRYRSCRPRRLLPYMCANLSGEPGQTRPSNENLDGGVQHEGGRKCFRSAGSPFGVLVQNDTHPRPQAICCNDACRNGSALPPSRRISTQSAQYLIIARRSLRYSARL